MEKFKGKKKKKNLALRLTVILECETADNK